MTELKISLRRFKSLNLFDISQHFLFNISFPVEYPRLQEAFLSLSHTVEVWFSFNILLD